MCWVRCKDQNCQGRATTCCLMLWILSGQFKTQDLQSVSFHGPGLVSKWLLVNEVHGIRTAYRTDITAK